MSARARRWTRGGLRAGQLACAVWVIVAVVDVLTASPALADHCAQFSDCFGQANSAAEAGFGLMLLTIFSMALNFVPVVGDVKGVAEAIIGRDLLTGAELETWERVAGIIPILPIGDVARLIRGLDDLADLGRGAGAAGDLGRGLDDVGDLGRGVDDAGDLGRGVDDASPIGRGDDGGSAPGGGSRPRAPDTGTTYDLPPSSRPLVDEYLDPATTPARRRAISEVLGEQGATRYLEDVSGRPDLTAMNPVLDVDVAGYADMVRNGEAWPSAVAFGGRNATNVVYFDGQTMHIVEAKGGSSAFGDRVSVSVRPGERISQTDPQYPLDVASDMRDSPLTDGRNEIGEAIRRAYLQDDVRYVAVRAGDRAALLAGDPVVTVERIFLEPGP